jgi:predicted DNA-binding transcriptional regulator YafY
VARILSVLGLIQSRGRWTTKAIAEEIESSERTVYRDLEVLEFAGVPWYRDPGDHTIRLRSDYRFPVLMLTDDELLGQAVATALTKAPGLNVTAGATPTTRKLAATTPQTQQLLDDAARMIEVLDLKIADHSRHHETLRTVQSALLRRRQITGHYESPYEPSSTKLRMHPFRLCLIKNAWYVIGRPVDASAPRTYRVARFKSLRMIEEKADIPREFDLRAYLGNAWSVYRGDRSYDVEIRFTPEGARVVTETVWHHTQKVVTHRDGSVTLSFQVDGLEEIANWIMSWAGRATVLQPAELRSLVVDKLRKALDMHEEQGHR